MLDRRNCLAYIVGAACPALAAQPDKAPTLIASLIDIAPWGLAGADGRPTGIYARIFERLAERSGCGLRLQLAPIRRAVVDVINDDSQLTMMLDRQDLNENASVLGLVTELRIVVWLPRGKPARGLGDLAGRTIGVLRGPAYHEAFAADTRIVKYEVANPRQQLEMLRAGRLDGALGVQENFEIALRQLEPPATDAFEPPLDLGLRKVLLWASRPLASAPCGQAVGRALALMRASGEIERLIRP